MSAVSQRRWTVRPHPSFAGWAMLSIGGWALFLSAAAQTYGFSVFIDPMLAEFGWSRSFISAAYTVATLVSAAAVLLVGGLIDRYGQRRVMTVTAAIYVAALLLMGSVTNPFSLLVGFTLLRVSGSSVLTLTARTLVSQWFVRQRGRAVSLINLGKLLGMAAVPPASAVLIAWLGWRMAWQTLALFVALLIPLTLIFVRNRPEDVGQYPDGTSSDDAGTGSPVGSYADETSWTLREALRTRTLWLLLSACFVPAMITNGLSFNQISILAASGLPSTLAAITFSVESAIALPTTLAAGWLVDRFGPRYVLAAGQVTLLLAMICLAFATTPALAILFGGLRGLTTGLWILAAEVAWPAYFGRRHLGSLLGASFAASFVGAAVGPLPFGLVYDAFGSYDYAIGGLAILPAVTTWAALLAAPPAPKDPREG
ncbi:MAG TPA: MFS transporter [Thermomicrobiales bacterium]|nr:MFS transporter [Thermomicrobiales bacterium]